MAAQSGDYKTKALPHNPQQSTASRVSDTNSNPQATDLENQAIIFFIFFFCVCLFVFLKSAKCKVPTEYGASSDPFGFGVAAAHCHKQRECRSPAPALSALAAVSCTAGTAQPVALSWR